MQERGAGNPRQQRRVLNRVPRPIAAPAEHGVGPVCAQQHADALKAPCDHGPAARDVNPFFAGITAEQRGHRKRKRDRESGVAEVQHRRMNHHLRILEEGIEAGTFGKPRDVHYARRIGGGHHVKRAGDEIIQREEKDLNTGERDADVGHQFRMLAAIQKQRQEDVDRQQPAPPEQGTFLPGPERREFVVERQGAVAVRGDVGEREIVGEEKILKRGDGEGDEAERRHSGIARAFRHQNAARDDAHDSGDERVHRCQEREKQRKRAEDVQTKSPGNLGFVRNTAAGGGRAGR